MQRKLNSRFIYRVGILGFVILFLSITFASLNFTADAQSPSGATDEEICGAWLNQTKYFEVRKDYCGEQYFTRCFDEDLQDFVTCQKRDCITRTVTEGYLCKPAYQWQQDGSTGVFADPDFCTTDAVIDETRCSSSYTTSGICPINYTLLTFKTCYGGTPPPPPSTSTSCVSYSSQPTLNRYPQYNPNRTAVRTMQSGLMELGYSLPRYGADGYYGAETANAISQFKSANGLSGGGDVFEQGTGLAWQTLAEKLNDARGQSSCNADPTTYTLRMRSSIILPDGTNQNITGVAQTTCLGNGETGFSKESNSARNDCAISTEPSITYGSSTYDFAYWSLNGTSQSDTQDSSIDVDKPNDYVVARAFYEQADSSCTPEVCDGADNDCDGEVDEGLTCGGGGICGDGVIDQGEECDGGNNCQYDCTLAECVDGSDNDGDGATDGNDAQCTDCTLTGTCDGGGGCVGGGCGQCTGIGCDDSEDDDIPDVWIEADPRVAQRGGQTNLSWGVDNLGEVTGITCRSSANPDNSGWQDGEVISTSGSKFVTLGVAGLHTFTITCTNSGDEPGSDSTNVLVSIIKEVLP